MTTLLAVLAGGAPGYGAAIIALAVAKTTARRQKLALERLREEFDVRLAQQRTEYRDEARQLTESVAFLEQSAQQSEDLLSNRMTSSQRGKAMQLLRSGLSTEKAAASLGMSRNEVRLIATISKACRL